MKQSKKLVETIIKPELRAKLKVKRGEIPNFLPDLDRNTKYQSDIWSGKTYKVDPKTYIFTTIQERYGNRLLQSFVLPKQGVAVDIGCFIGEKLWQLRRNKDYLGVGVDIAMDSLMAAQKIDPYGHVYLAADMEKLPFKDNSVDLVIVFDVIEHLTHPEKGFSEVARILKPGGKFLLHIPIKNNRGSLFWWKQKLFPVAAEKDYLDVGHAPERMLSTEQIQAYLKKYNLRIEKETYYNSFFVYFWDREFFKFLAFLSVKLFRSGKAISKEQQRTTHTGELGKIRSIYGKYIIPLLEVVSLPDWILSKSKIGNTYFSLSTKELKQFDYYYTNEKYSRFLNQSKPEHFIMYTNQIQKIAKKNKKTTFLDVGCGTGVVANEVAKMGIQAYGIDISKTSIQKAKKKQGIYSWYDGNKIPFKANTFDIVGSFDVAEHVEDVNHFLEDSVRVVRKGGYLIVCAPNFLSITSSYHYRTAGIARKIKNVAIVIIKCIQYPLGKNVVFEKFAPILRDNFQPDDDAVNLINPLDIVKWGKKNGLTLVTSQGAILPYYLSYKLRNIPFINLLTGGVFVVFRKI